MSFEILFGVGIVILFAAIAWAAYRSSQRTNAARRVTDKAARELHEHPEQYERDRPALEREARAKDNPAR